MPYHVYILETCDEQDKKYRPTYVGATVDLDRRLRQHNCELAGGARRTTKHAKGSEHRHRWRIACTVTGFRTWPEALKFEYAIRRVGRQQVRRWNLEGRRRAMELLMQKERWSSTSPLASEVPLEVKWM